MISFTRSRIVASNPSRREPSWPASIAMLVFAMAYSSCALNLLLRGSGLFPSLTSQENTSSNFLQESGQSLNVSGKLKRACFRRDRSEIISACGENVGARVVGFGFLGGLGAG